MTLPRRVSDVLADHMTLVIECIDRVYLNVFVQELQRTGQVIGFLMRHRGFPIASTALVAPMSRQFVSDIHDFAAAYDVPLIRFAKGQRKDDVMAGHLAGFTGGEGIVFKVVGSWDSWKAQSGCADEPNETRPGPPHERVAPLFPSRGETRRLM